ncbi:MAG TPA: molecular chaperone [Rhodospirillaceae bacterium]|nr:molecular chaperone [Rhodospirillaceae bacterium]|tara:strand:+ start:2147 stop:3052 length:906 start_codon:yes stop_codon:yes gene_type:complete
MPDMTLSLDDVVQPFHVDALGVNGRVVRLGPILDQLVGPHGYPPVVADLLSQVVVLAATLSSVLKFDGVFTLQVQGDGPVGLVMADVTSAGGVRSYARFDADRLAAVDAAGAQGAPVPALLGSGYLAFTVDQGPDTDRYQGITELVGATLADCAHDYFRQSEQLETAILLASDADPLAAGAIMVQRLPDKHGADKDETEEAWRRAVILMSSLSSGELLDPAVATDRLLYRLYHQDGVRVTEGRPVKQTCRCSRDKVEMTLRSFPRAEIEDMADDGTVTVTCEFCRTDYVFGPDQIEALYQD